MPVKYGINYMRADWDGLGPYSPTILVLCLFLQDFVSFKVTQVLIG